jgi:hypothetical protein
MGYYNTNVIIVILCIMVICTIYNKDIEKYTTYIVGSDEYSNKPWHKPGGALYYKYDKITPYEQDAINYRGHAQETEYVSDILTGVGGSVPPIGEDDTGNEYLGPPTQSITETKESFSYDIDRLKGSGWYSKELDKGLKSTLGGGNNLIKSSTGNSHMSTNSVDEFSNRATTYWNEKDYPIVTSNGLDMTSSFPQDGDIYVGVQKLDIPKMLTGQDITPIYNTHSEEMAQEAKMDSNTMVDHKIQTE